MYLNSEVPVLPVRVFGLFSFIHLSHSRVTVPSEATERAGNCCFTVLLIKIHTVLAMIQAEQHQKQSDLNPAGIVKSETATDSVWKQQRDGSLHQRSFETAEKTLAEPLPAQTSKCWMGIGDTA